MVMCCSGYKVPNKIIERSQGLDVVYSEDVQEVSWHDVWSVGGSLKMWFPNQFIIPVNEEACVVHLVLEEDEEIQNPNFITDFHDWEGIKKASSLMDYVPAEKVFGQPGCPTMVAD